MKFATMQWNFLKKAVIKKPLKSAHQSSIQVNIILVSDLIDHVKIPSQQPRTTVESSEIKKFLKELSI
jgi:hypothetical protein